MLGATRACGQLPPRLSEPLGYILKPIRDDELVANIEMTLYRSKMDALRQRERELAGILDGLNQGVVAFNNDGRVTFLNSLAETALGLSRAEAQDMQAEEIASRLGSRSPNSVAKNIPMKDADGNITGRFLVLNVTG
jgi:PAS domain-containing protein